jgi:hypothetical protein
MGFTKDLSGLYLDFVIPCQQLAHFMFIGIFLKASEISELLGSYQEYPDESDSGTNFFYQDSLSEILSNW